MAVLLRLQTPVLLVLWLIWFKVVSVQVNAQKICTFDREGDCPLWNFTSSFRIVTNNTGHWSTDETSEIFNVASGGNLAQMDCQNAANPVPLVKTSTLINSSSSSCALSFDLVIPDRDCLESVEVILQRPEMRDHLLWSESDSAVTSGWSSHRIVIGHIKEPFRIVFESYCATPEKEPSGPLLVLDNLHFESCFPGLMKDNACNSDQIACHPSGTCLDSGVICDFQADCDDFSDENPALCDSLPSGARCDFENDWCQWAMTQPDDLTMPGNSTWIRASVGESPGIRISADHTTSSSHGHYLLLDLQKSQKNDMVNQIRSPIYPRIHPAVNPASQQSGCQVTFYYTISGLTDGNVVLLVESVQTKGSRHTIWQLRHRKNDNLADSWRRISVPIIDLRSRYVLRFIGVPGSQPGIFAVDDIALSRACFFRDINADFGQNSTQIDHADIEFENHFEITSCGKVGPQGPTTQDCLPEHRHDWVVLGDNLSLSTHATVHGIRQWTVGITGMYNITAVGAPGGGISSVNPDNSCSPSVVSGLFFLKAGELIGVVVGQCGDPVCSGDVHSKICSKSSESGGGGGGGSFVFKNDISPELKCFSLLLVAAGGKGHSAVTASPQNISCLTHVITNETGSTWDMRVFNTRTTSPNVGQNNCTVAGEFIRRAGGFGGGSASCGLTGGFGGGFLSSNISRNDFNNEATSFVNQKMALRSDYWKADGVQFGRVTITILCHNCPVACVLDQAARQYYCPSLIDGDDLENPVLSLPEEKAVHYVLAAVLLVASVAGILGCFYLGTRKGVAKCVRRRAEFLSCETQFTEAQPFDSVRLPHLGNHNRMEINQLYELNGVRKLDDLHHIPRKLIHLKQPIGEGAFGIVYQGILNQKTGECLPVAVKTLPSMTSVESEVDFAAEAVIVCRFHHPNVVQCLGVSFEKVPKYIVLELLSGGDVRTFLRRCRNPVDRIKVTMLELLELAADIAKGCQYLEQYHFVHRDIAARNCLLTSVDKPRTAKIADFGMARDVVRSDYYRRNSSVLLPVRWMSPEALQEGVFTVKSDVWAYGVFLWEVFSTGCSPYGGLNNQEVIRYVTNGGRLSPPSASCPTELYDLMKQCWAPTPLDRRKFSEIIPTLLGLMGVSTVLTAHVPDEKDPPLALGPLAQLPPAYLDLNHSAYTLNSSSSFDRSSERDNFAMDAHSGSRLLP